MFIKLKDVNFNTFKIFEDYRKRLIQETIDLQQARVYPIKRLAIILKNDIIHVDNNSKFTFGISTCALTYGFKELMFVDIRHSFHYEIQDVIHAMDLLKAQYYKRGIKLTFEPLYDGYNHGNNGCYSVHGFVTNVKDTINYKVYKFFNRG